MMRTEKEAMKKEKSLIKWDILLIDGAADIIKKAIAK